MKKVLAFVLAMVMVFALAACSSNTPATEPKADDTSAPAADNTPDTQATEPVAENVNATVIWRAFDDQFQSGFRIIM